MLLKNKNAIITGSNRGIGKAILTEFAKQGANIWAVARKQDNAFIDFTKELASEYEVNVNPLFFDMTDYDAMKKAVMDIRKEKRPVDILVNNAGIVKHTVFQMTREEDLRNIFEVNFFSVFLFTQYITKLMMLNKSGSIINISSISANGYPTESAYGASKAAIITMTKSIAQELGSVGIRANCLAPGFIKTDMLEQLPNNIIEEYTNFTALKRTGLGADIAGAAVFLASELSSFISGQVIRVDGGLR